MTKKKDNNSKLNRKILEEMAQRPQGVTWYEMAEQRGYDLTRSKVYRLSFESAIKKTKGGFTYKKVKGKPVLRNGQPVLTVTDNYRKILAEKQQKRFDADSIVKRLLHKKCSIGLKPSNLDAEGTVTATSPDWEVKITTVGTTKIDPVIIKGPKSCPNVEETTTSGPVEAADREKEELDSRKDKLSNLIANVLESIADLLKF